MKRLLILLLGIVILAGGVPLNAQAVEITIPITIYNNSDNPVYNGTYHIVLTPNNATFPINTDTLYVTLDNGRPIYYAFNLGDIDTRQYYAIVPGLIMGGETVKYTTSAPLPDWFEPSYNDTSWNTGTTPFGNYTGTQAYYIYSEIFDQGYYSFNNPRTPMNITTLWVRVWSCPVPSGYRLVRAWLGIAYGGGVVEAFINGYNVTGLVRHGLSGVYIYNASLGDDLAVIDVTDYINTTAHNLVAVFVNDTGLPSSVTRIFDVWLSYEIVPDYSKYLSLYVRIPYIAPHSYQVIVIHYNLYNVYPSYRDASKVFLLYDTFTAKESWWLWGNTTNYDIGNGLLIHNYTLGRTSPLWYPIDITDYNAIYIKYMGITSETSLYGDITILVTNETNPIINYTSLVQAYMSDYLGGGIIYLDAYNYTSGYISGIGLPVYVPVSTTTIITNSSITIRQKDNTTETSYTLIAPQGHSLNTIKYIGIDIKGWGALEYIAIYQSSYNYTVEYGLPPNYVPPSPAFAGNYINIYVNTNGTIYVSLNNIQAYKYNTTVLRVGFINNSFIRIVYTGQYIESYNELVPFKVSVYGDNTTLITNITFIPVQSQTHIVVEYADINVSLFKQVEIYVYNYNTGELLKVMYINIPHPMLMYGYLSYLAYLIPFAILIAFTLRGNIKTVALGFILYSLVTLVLPYIGINMPYSIIISGIAMLFGIVLAIISR